MKFVPLLLLLATATSRLGAQAGPLAASSPIPQVERDALERARLDIWTQWYAGDTASLRRVLASDLVAISQDAPGYQSLASTLAGAARYRAGGGSLVSISFDSTVVQSFRDVAVLFSHYAVITTKDGVRSRERGLATEVYVRRNGRWIQSSWHLDVRP